MKRILSYIIFLVLLASCGEDSVVKPLDHTPNTNPNPSIDSLARQYAPEPMVIDITNEKGGIVRAPRGSTEILFPPNTYGSTPGTVTLKIYEIYNVKNMVGTGVFTETEDGRFLNSEGMFKVFAYQNGTLVQPQLDVQINMPISAGSTPADTKLFELIESVDTNRMQMIGKWRELNRSWTADSSRPGRVNFTVSLLNWCNLDKYIQSGTNNKIKLTVPEGFTNRNTSVYFNLDGVRGVTLLNADPINKNFFTLDINQGLSGTVYVVAQKGNIYYKKIIKVSFTAVEQTFNLDVLDPSNRGEIEAILSGM